MDLLTDGPADARATLVLAHGAGAPMDSPFMNAIAAGLAEAGILVVRFEFPYMSRRRSEGRRGGPDPMPVLLGRFRDVIATLGAAPLLVGGKSLGGRVASLVADAASAAGLVCLGYPFHPPGQPTKLRIAHLEKLATPTLIVQGTRDPFGGFAEVAAYPLSPCIELEWLDDGDHSFKPRVRSGRTLEQNLAQAVAAIVAFVAAL